MADMPEAKHVVIDGQVFAEIEGRRYPMKEINGVLCFRDDVALKIMKRYATPSKAAAFERRIREAKVSQAPGSSRVQ